jgi:hypothetical protein
MAGCELAEDGDTLFELADLGFGCRNWAISLREIAAVRLPFGLRIERDETFASRHPLSLWAQTARHLEFDHAGEIALHLIGF